MNKAIETPFEWKTSNEEILDPFLLPGEEIKKTPLQLPPPNPKFSLGEKNQIHREFLEEIEDRCKEIHSQLQFFESNNLRAEDLAQYSEEEIATILKHESQLNHEQLQAALICHNDLYIKALAGTGKTSLLSACIARLLALGTDPQTIAISSHTVTAAEEIKGRIFPTLERLFPKTRESLGSLKPSTGTIHAIAYRELLAHKHPKARWTILDETQQFRVWMEANQFANPNNSSSPKEENTWEQMRLFDRVRNYDIPEKMIPKVLRLITEDEKTQKVSEIYNKIKEARRLLDYTDLLREWSPLIIHPGYKNKWEYFFIDEFQDTNPLQKFLMKLLKHAGTKLVVCGDNRQSINSFSGSDPTSHTEFFKQVGIQEAWLQTNYRCSKEILGLANEILKSMSPTEEGQLHPNTHSEAGPKPKLILTWDSSNKQKFLATEEHQAEKEKENQISCREAINLYQTLLTQETQKPSVAILYRTNTQGGSLEETLAKINTERQKNQLPPIKYIRKDFRRTALRNKTEREIISILSCWCNPETTNWESLLLSPYFHGIGEVTARNIHKKGERKKPKNREESEALFEKELSKRNAETMDSFFQAWEEAETPVEQSTEENPQPDTHKACKSLYNWIQQGVIKKSYEKGSKKEVEEAQRRSYETSLLERVQNKISDQKSLQDILQDIQEENERNTQAQNNANRALGLGENQLVVEKEEGIILSTIHLAKGREYDGVVIHQVSEGSLPHLNAMWFYKKEQNLREKSFRKYSTFPALQTDGINWDTPTQTLPKIWRKQIPNTPPKNPVEEWEDQNNPLEEEKRLLYVAVTRAKKILVITSKDHYYPYLPQKIWKKLKNQESFLQTH